MSRVGRSVGLGLSLVLALGASTGACNSITGSDDLSVGDPEKSKPGGGGDDDGRDDDDDDDDGSDATVGSGGGGSVSSAESGASVTTGAELQLVDAPGVSITDISIYQGIKAQIAAGGSPRTPDVPIVAGRDALLRVFTDVSAYDGQPVVVREDMQGAAGHRACGNRQRSVIAAPLARRTGLRR